jgi:pyrroline-5-carboxylate reductase
MKISFIGGGNMASALISGLINKQEISQILVVEPFIEQQTKLNDKFSHAIGQGRLALSGEVLTQHGQSDVIVMSVKPQQMQQACEALATVGVSGLVLSIAAGTTISSIRTWLNNHPRVVRAMPNTPATLGLGISGLVGPDNLSAADHARASTVMRAAGEVLWVNSEAKINAVTAVSGSGPGYVFYLMEAMQAGAVAQGFSVEDAKLLTEHTFAGASQLALQSGTAFSTLREQVTSKGGTTHAGLESLRNDDVAQAITAAITAANRRAEELGKA